MTTIEQKLRNWKANTITFPQNVDPSVDRIYRDTPIDAREYRMDISKSMGMCWVAGLLHQDLGHGKKLLSLYKQHKKDIQILIANKTTSYYYHGRNWRGREETPYWKFNIFYTQIHEVTPCCMCDKMVTCLNDCKEFNHYVDKARGIKYAKRHLYAGYQRKWEATKKKKRLSITTKEGVKNV